MRVTQENEAYRILQQMFEVIERTTYRSARECFNTLVRYLADCARVHPLPENEHHIGERLLPLTMPFLAAFYEDPQDHLGTIFSEKGCANDNLSQLITPRAIVRYINEQTMGRLDEEVTEGDEQEWKTVLDPCTGTGRFLVETALQFPRRKLVFFGVELDLDLYRAALVNMRLTAWHRPYYILCANTLVVDVRPNSPNWQYANQWDPPNWETQMVMEDGRVWAEWGKEQSYEVREAPTPRRDPGSTDPKDPLQLRLL